MMVCWLKPQAAPAPPVVKTRFVREKTEGGEAESTIVDEAVSVGMMGLLEMR